MNAVSYVMYSYSLLINYIDRNQHDAIRQKIRKLYNYVKLNQAVVGSWAYSPDPPSFIDCFHSCIVIKNILKTARLVELDGSQDVASRGYEYLKKNMWSTKDRLFKRFAKSNKPGMVKFDLYDNAEMLNLAWLMNDNDLVRTLDESINRMFIRGDDIYSRIDRFGIRHDCNMLRWAVMPYIYAVAVTGESHAK